MYILSFKDGHDSAACILKDGEIIAACEEERFCRKKHAPSIFPAESIAYCLKEAGIEPSQVGHVIYARLKPIPAMLKVITYYLLRPPRNLVELEYAYAHLMTQIKGALQQCMGRARYQNIHKRFSGLPKYLHQIDHHFAHAASTYLYSGFDKALIVTMDGKGEATSVASWLGEGTSIKNIERRGVSESLGLWYSSITKFLGFTPNDGEYKVMGMAPYGSKNKIAQEMLRSDSRRGYILDSRFALYPNSLRTMEKRFGLSRPKEAEMSQTWLDFAASCQEALEEAALSYIRQQQSRTGIRTLCLAGGVALNVKMNQRIWESGMFDRIFIQPAAGDDGLVLGAAGYLYLQLTGQKPSPLKHLYLGPSYTDDEIAQEMRSRGVIFDYIDSPERVAADLIANNRVIGWFQGRMEFGPRALGARSVLANPRKAEMRDLVNAKIKYREAFRPFCPSVSAAWAKQALRSYISSPFMILSFAVNDDSWRHQVPAVIHVDGTVRPQEVDPETNPLYADLLVELESTIGVPVVLNTSMNIRGEPIVCTPKDLVDFFLKTHIDAIVAGKLVALKEKQNPSILQTIKEHSLVTEY